MKELHNRWGHRDYIILLGYKDNVLMWDPKEDWKNAIQTWRKHNSVKERQKKRGRQTERMWSYTNHIYFLDTLLDI